MTSVGISVEGLGKAYRVYDRPSDRLREIVSPSRKKYGRQFWALKDVSFQVPHGATYGLVGPNGAGKSTTLKILADRLRPTTGTKTVAGRVSSILELGTGLQPLLTGRQNARVNAIFMGLDPWRIERKLDQILEFADLGEHADLPLETYSSGMKSRLAFSVLTALEPEILLLDEALAAGDSGFSHKCTEFIRDLCRSGCTVIVVSHDLGFMAETCDHLIWLDHGSIRDEGDPAQVLSQYRQSFGLRSDLRQRPRYVLFRIESTSGSPYLLNCIEWVDGEGAPIEQTFAAAREGQQAIQQAGRFLGLTPAAARGWGEVRTHDDIPGAEFRELVFAEAKAGRVLLPLAVPQAPLPFPESVRLWGMHSLPDDLTVSVCIDGEFQPVGSFGQSDHEPGVAMASAPLPTAALLAGPQGEAA